MINALMNRKTALVAIAVLLLLVTGGGARGWRVAAAGIFARKAFVGDTVFVFGPTQYNGSSGQGQTYVEQFTTTVTPGRLYSIRLVNGAPSGTNRASKVIVKLNGFEIVSQNEVTQAVAELSRPVAVTDVDTLSVTVAGSGSPFINLSILSTPDNSFNVDGPTQYAVTSGSSTTHSGSFSRSATAATPYRVYVTNGASDGTQRVTSGSVSLNGTQVVTTSELTSAVGSLTKVVTLNASNTLGVTVNGSVGRFITVRFTATDTTKPGLTITAPAPNGLTNQTTIAVTGTISDQTATTVTVNGVAATVTSNTSYTASVPLASEGNNLLTVTATDAAGNSVDSTRTVTRDTQAPALSVSAPVDGLITRDATTPVQGTTSDANGVTVNTNGTPWTVAGGGFSGSIALSSGANVLTTTATDGAGNATSVVRNVTHDATPPTLTVTAPANGATTTADSITVSGTVSDLTAVTVAANGVNLPVVSGAFSRKIALAEGENPVTVTATDAAGNTASTVRTVTREVPIPPDPATVATPIDPTVPTTLAASTAFLYSGSNPIQTGVTADTIKAHTAGVVRGKVVNRAGTPLSGVKVTVLNHAEFGQTFTRSDGRYDLALNAGSAMTLQFTRAGFVTVQRQVPIGWQQFSPVDSVALTPLDTAATVIGFSNPTEVARGSTVSDADGTRKATAIFEQGTQATLLLPSGSTQPISSITVRATEFTVGGIGDAAMPGTLPSASAYTYAAELSADEAIAAGATQVQFSQPVSFYVENFLNFPVGTRVPVGAYDRTTGKWTAEPDGRVIKILSVTSGRADLDLTGSGQVAGQSALDSLGVADAERERIATLYPVGQTLWRTEHTHFSPHDWNWPWGLPEKAAQPQADVQEGNNTPKCRGIKPGSIIECESQTLGEVVPVTGTPFTLNYRSDMVLGNTVERRITVAPQTRVDTAIITGTRPFRRNEFPSHVVEIFYQLEVAGRSIIIKPPLGSTVPGVGFTWDGKDAYGRLVNGRARAKLNIGFVYNARYGVSITGGLGGGFGSPPGNIVLANPARRQIARVQVWEGELGAWDNRGQGLGGWTLNARHSYDPVGGVLQRGDGDRVPAKVLGNTITRFAGTGTIGNTGDGGPAVNATINSPQRIVAGPDGSVYFPSGNRVRRVDPQGIITTVAGNGTSGSGGDDGPATAAQLTAPRGVALGPDGSLYISDISTQKVRRVSPSGTITTVAGTGTAGFSGDGGPATATKLSNPKDVAVSSDGILYIADAGNNRVRRVGPDGVISTFAGTGVNGYNGTDLLATSANLSLPSGLAVAGDGTVYIADQNSGRIRKVGIDGIIRHVAGGDLVTFGGDGKPANDPAVRLRALEGMAVGPDGSLYIADGTNWRVRQIGTDGIINTVVGKGTQACDGLGCAPNGNDGLALQAPLYGSNGVAVSSDGVLYLADGAQIRKAAPGLPGLGVNDMVIAGSDGGIYQFDAAGRHRVTRQAMTGDTLLAFGYDGAGRLATVTDADQNVTTIERDGQGRPTAAVGPFGQRTTFTLDTAGYLASVTNPKGERVRLFYSPGGLLDSLMDPRSKVHRFAYDSVGRLRRDDDPAGGFKTLALTEGDTNYTVAIATALGRTTQFRVDRLPTRATRRLITDPAGLATTQTIGLDGSITTVSPDGSSIAATEQTDPRWGISAPVLKSLTVGLPSGLTSSVTAVRRATLTTASDPFSLTSQLDSLRVNGQAFVTQYDPALRRYTSTTPEGRQTVTRIDSAGRPLMERLVGLDSVSYQYDPRGRLSEVRSGGRTWSYAYDPAGRLLSTTDPLGRTDSLFYDTADRLARRVLPGGRQVEFVYDSSGNLTSLTPPGRPAHLFTHTAVDQDSLYAPPSLGAGTWATEYRYNLDRQLTEVRRPDGVTVGFGYDPTTGRPSTVTFDRGTLGFGYSPTTGQLTSLTAPGAANLAFTYDGLLPKTATWSGPVAGSVGVGYNSDFRVTSQTVNGANSIAFGHDHDGLLTAAGALGLKRAAQTGLLERDSVGTVLSVWGYNPRGALASYNASAGGTALFQASYLRDSLSRITELTETVQGVASTIAFTYDSAGRLETVRRDGTLTASYRYDVNGNRLDLTTPGGVVSGTYDAQDRLTQYGTTTYTYTGNGERWTKVDGTGTTTYTYDALGNLTRVQLPGGTDIEYLIDPQNRRIGKKVNGTLIQGLLWQGQLAPVAELDGSGQVVSRFVYGTRVNVPDYLIKGGQTYRLVLDHLGSVRLVVNTADGTVAQRIDYDEFGQVTQNTNPGFQPFGYAGGLYDAQTGLVRFGARDYDPAAGRWTTKEPLGLAGGDPNMYVYAFGNPINFVDPTGLYTRDCEELRQEIQEVRAEITRRFAEQRFNKYNLFETRPTGPNSWDGHNQAIRNQQARLRDLLDEWDDGPCNGSGGKLPADARRWATAPVPEAPAPRESPGRARFQLPDFSIPTLSPQEAGGLGAAGAVILIFILAPLGV